MVVVVMVVVERPSDMPASLRDRSAGTIVRAATQRQPLENQYLGSWCYLKEPHGERWVQPGYATGEADASPLGHLKRELKSQA